MSCDREYALSRLNSLFVPGLPRRGVPYSAVGLNFGYSKKHADIKPLSALKGTLVSHELNGLYAHHEKMSISRIKWHIEHCDDLFNNVRPMLLSVEDDKKYIIDGCHRTVALLLFGVESFPYATFIFD